MMANRLFQLGFIGLLLCSIIVCSVVSAEDTSQTALELLWKYKMDQEVSSIAISDNPMYIAGTDTNRNIYLLNSEGKLLWKYHHSDITPYPISVALPTDGSVVAASTFETLYLFDTTGKVLWKYLPQTGYVHNVAISRDGQYIAAGVDGIDRGVCKLLFFKRDGTLLWNYSLGNYVTDISISDDGRYVVAGSGDHNVNLLNRDGVLLWKVHHAAVIGNVAISGDGGTIIAGDLNSPWNKNLFFYNNNGALLWNAAALYMVGDLAMTQDGRHIVVGTWGNATELFDSDGNLIWQHFTCVEIGPLNDGAASSVAITSNGDYIADGCEVSGQVHLYRNSFTPKVSTTPGTMPLYGNSSSITTFVSTQSPANTTAPERSPVKTITPDNPPAPPVSQDPIRGFICFIKKIFGGAC
jgi:WD40 repeat protein